MSLYQCPYCWKTGNRRTIQADHIIPTSRGGCECDENKTPSCWYCNLRKQGKTPLEYFSWLSHVAGHFDYWGYSKREREKLLVQLAELEFRAARHMKKAHNKVPMY